MAQKTGALIFDETADRYDIRFDLNDYYGGLHCGDCLVLGRDESRVYTVEGNSGDACKIKSYDLNYQCIKGYGLMNW